MRFSIDQSQSFESMATQTAKRKPVFVKVDQLKPGTNGHTLTVKVVNSSPVKTVPNRGGRSAVIASRPSRIAECLIGDETASIIFTARNEQGTIFCVYVSFLSILDLKEFLRRVKESIWRSFFFFFF